MSMRLRSVKVTFVEKPQIKINSLKKQPLLSDRAYKGTVVNWTLPSFHGGKLEITLTVPLTVIFCLGNL